jgi:phosphate transport system substrate-binding protein
MIRQMFAASILMSAPLASAATISLQGSDTMAGYMTDVITASGLESSVVYTSGGSTLGEAALVAKTQHIAAMSRAFKPEALAQAAAAGVKVVEHVIGLDGVGVFVNSANGIPSLTLDQLKKIYTCEITNWSAVGGSNQAIKAYRRNDNSGTTDTFKTLVGITNFGACVKVVAETSDIAVMTSTEANAVGYAGLSAHRDGNREVALAKNAASKAVAPSPASIRSFEYPLSRNLYIYEAEGALSVTEQTLLDNILDRSFSDPILVDHEFLTLD